MPRIYGVFGKVASAFCNSLTASASGLRPLYLWSPYSEVACSYSRKKIKEGSRPTKNLNSTRSPTISQRSSDRRPLGYDGNSTRCSTGILGRSDCQGPP